MKKRLCSIVCSSLLTVVLLTAFSGCNSTRVKDGVTIEKKSGNPLKFW